MAFRLPPGFLDDEPARPKRVPPAPMNKLDRAIKQALEGKLFLRGRRRELRLSLDALASKFPFEDDPLFHVAARNGRQRVSRFIRAPSREVLESEALKLNLENLEIVVWANHWPWVTTLNLLLHAEAKLEDLSLDVG